jgi:hypothetical protein
MRAAAGRTRKYFLEDTQTGSATLHGHPLSSPSRTLPPRLRTRPSSSGHPRIYVSSKKNRGYNCYTNQSSGEWKRTELKVDAVAWRVSWSLSGNALAVSTGDNRVSLWKERLSGGWECVKTIEE